MAFGMTSAIVAEYASRPFIHAALAAPIAPNGVLSFFLGVDYNQPEQAAMELESGSFIQPMLPFWFGGHPDYDKLCKSHFQSLIRELAQHTRTAAAATPPMTEWTETVNGKMAQLILFDQLSRNVFRGTEEAFAYDDDALEISKSLVQEFVFSPDESTEAPTTGTFYPTYAIFPVTCLMHSEDMDDHDMLAKVIDWAQERTNLDVWWNSQRKFASEHSDVLAKFGRYPHRNQKKGRESTPKEEAWLSNKDDLPMWAKSQ